MALLMGVLLACQLGVCSDHTDSFPPNPSRCPGLSMVSVASAILDCWTNALTNLVKLKAGGGPTFHCNPGCQCQGRKSWVRGISVVDLHLACEFGCPYWEAS